MRNWATLLSLFSFSPLPFLAEGGLKTYCVLDEDDDCDSEWTPFPNMGGDSDKIVICVAIDNQIKSS